MTRRIGFAILASAPLLLSLGALPAGPFDPPILRVVTMEGETGPAYYSVVERRYRFVEAEPTALASLGASVSGSARGR